MPRLFIAPDPEAPGFFYAECLDTGRRLYGLTSLTVPMDRWYETHPDQPSLPLSEPVARLHLVEHPVPSVHERAPERESERATCLEPGCFQPAALYCEVHRYQMEGTSY